MHSHLPRKAIFGRHIVVFPLRPQLQVLSVGWCQWMSSAFPGCWSCRSGCPGFWRSLVGALCVTTMSWGRWAQRNPQNFWKRMWKYKWTSLQEFLLIPCQHFFVYGHQKDDCLDKMFFCGNRGQYESISLYTWYTDVVEGLRHDLA